MVQIMYFKIYLNDRYAPLRGNAKYSYATENTIASSILLKYADNRLPAIIIELL